MSAATNAYDWAVGIANDQKHGYSQESRWGTAGTVSDFDCSSLVISAFEQAGVPLKSKGATYTGNLREVALSCGFMDVTKEVNLLTGAGLKKGDILMYHKSGPIGHTALASGDGRIVHARGQSYGSPAPGDQGSEIAVTAYYRGSWTTVLRYTGVGVVKTSPSPAKRYAVTTTLPMIESGDVGKAVEVWQKIVGTTEDGEFGPKTKAATIAFQQRHSLEVDGIAGPESWGAGLRTLGKAAGNGS